MALWRELGISARALRNAPGFTLTSILTLALGIGATTSIFSVADATLWKPVPLPNLDRMVIIVEKVASDPRAWNPISPPDTQDIREQSTAFEGVASWTGGLANIVGPAGEPERAFQVYPTANFFNVIGVRPAIGRGFEPGEDQPGREKVAVLSDKLWKRSFNADPAIVGQHMRVDDEDFLVIGVMPPDFEFPQATEIYTPLALKPEQRTARGAHMLQSIALLKPGQTAERAQAEVDAIAARLERQYPDTNRNRRFSATPALRFLIGDYSREYVMMLFWAVLFVLLIACVNVANLQFARAAGRVREVAVRTALGAARWRLVSQVITESVMISFAGAAVGLLFAHWGINMIRVSIPPEIVVHVLGWESMALDGRALAFTMVAALATGILAGIAPAWQFSRPNLNETLKDGGRGASAGRARQRLRATLVGAEVALAVILLVGAGLMVRGFRSIMATGATLEPSTMLTFRLAITEAKYPENFQVDAFYRNVLERTAAIPGVRAVIGATALPYTNHSNSRSFAIEGKQPEPGRLPNATYQAVTPNFAKVMNIPLRAGRLISPSDGADAPRVAVISERLASRWWPGEPLPIGRRIKIGAPDSPEPWLTIVGVTGDLALNFYDRTPRPTLYVPLTQAPSRWLDIGVRASGDPLALVPAVTAAVRSVDPHAPISSVFTLERAIRNNGIGLILVAVLMGSLGTIALVLSSVGVYGVMAFLVAQQTQEIGVRVALGASRFHVLKLVFRRGLTPALAGLAVGLAGSFALARLMASLVFGVTATDPATFTAIPLALLAAATLAIYIPARRATGIDPIIALRYE